MAADPADEAGGEIVYSSDGLAPIPISKPPVVLQKGNADRQQGSDEIVANDKDNNDNDEYLDSDEIPPQLAFEIFQGKVYTASSGGTSTGTSTGTSNNTKTFATNNAASLLEPPLVRLARLQQEILQVQSQCEMTAANTGREFDESLVTLATTLKTQLDSIMASQSHHFSSEQQDHLSRLIRQQIDSLPKQSQQQDGTTTTTTTSSTTVASESPTGVVFELYGNATTLSTSTVQDRLLTLERLVGSSQNITPTPTSNTSTTTAAIKSSAKPNSSSSSTLNNTTLMHRLEELEALVRTIDPQIMEQTTTKSKVIRADLEAASKARNKLMSAYKKEDSQKIQQLHQQLLELEGLSGYLPSLVERLQQLASLHVQTGTFASRLEVLETSTRQVESTVSQLERTMNELSTNLSQNLVTLEGNLQALDQRLNQL